MAVFDYFLAFGDSFFGWRVLVFEVEKGEIV